MSAYARSKKCRISYMILAVVIIFALLTSVFFRQLSKHIGEISELESKQAAADIINQSISVVTNDFKGDYVNVIRDDSGNIQSISAKTDCINNANSFITDEISKRLAEFENNEIQVPLGTLSGITYFSGRGAKIKLKIHQMGAVSTKMRSEFVSGGINQTNYRLYIDVSLEMSAILSGKSTDVTVNGSYLVNEMVIIGDVPNEMLKMN